MIVWHHPEVGDVANVRRSAGMAGVAANTGTRQAWTCLVHGQGHTWGSGRVGMRHPGQASWTGCCQSGYVTPVARLNLVAWFPPEVGRQWQVQERQRRTTVPVGNDHVLSPQVQDVHIQHVRTWDGLLSGTKLLGRSLERMTALLVY
eukprot:scaffold3898_cov401-Prasinococcus_capsulatus_cf.AAC.2